MTAGSSSPLRAGSESGASAYGRFIASVVSQQLQAWMPAGGARVLDISRSDSSRGSHGVGDALARGGADVFRILSLETELPHGVVPASGPVCAPRHPAVRCVVGDTRFLDWFRSACVGAVVAEGSALSSCLATEHTVEQAARLLRPGGRLLLSVDSLLYGLASLAEQHRWPELADATAADVVLVPDDRGSVTRCFGPEELRDLVEAAGFDVDWVRPRTVLPPDVVDHAVARDPGVLPDLVASELSLADEHQGESLGMYLTLSATLRR